MITSASPENNSGEGDGVYLTPTQQNKLVGTMLNPQRRWKLSKAAKAEAIETTLKNLSNDDPRVRNAAVANLVRMEAQNQSDQHKRLDKQRPDQHQVTGLIGHADVKELLANPDYVEYLRQRTVATDCDSGAICQIREPGYSPAVANGKAHGSPGPGTNGHHNGRE